MSFTCTSELFITIIVDLKELSNAKHGYMDGWMNERMGALENANFH